MTKLTRFLGVILVLAALPQCETENAIPLESAETPTAPPPAGIQTGTIFGKVRVTGTPVAGAQVSLTGPAGSVGLTTDKNGAFTSDDLSPGQYVLTVTMELGTCESVTTTIQVARETVVGIACEWDWKGSIQGFVTNEFGAFASTRVTASGPVDRETVSHRDGSFAFEGLPPGDYLLNACLHPDPTRVTVADGVTAFVELDCS